MKKFCMLLAAAVTAMFAVSCDSEEYDNYVEIGWRTYEVKKVTGDFYSEKPNYVEYTVYFELTKGRLQVNLRLDKEYFKDYVDGHMQDSCMPGGSFSFDGSIDFIEDASFWDGYGDVIKDSKKIESGTLTIAGGGRKYTVEFSGKDADSRNIRAKYSGLVHFVNG